MGLCKCPKKKVTNLFCFEHRVNVCETCLVDSHDKCVVQSYLQWLQDSDYNPNCTLCNQSLQDEECIRLTCYDVFHWRCLNQRMQRLPSNTAPAGYECPLCARPIIPTENAAGPVVDGVRARLRQAAWAQTAMGVGLELAGSAAAAVASVAASPMSPSVAVGTTPSSGAAAVAVSQRLPPDSVEMTSERGGVSKSGAASPTSAVKVRTAPSPIAAPAASAGYAAGVGRHQRDVDENKYARRPAFTWLAWVLRSSAGGGGGGRRAPLSPRRRLLLLGFLVFLAASTMLYMMSTLGRQAADSDPMLRPELNPNIRVQQHPAAVGVVGAARGSAPEII